MKRILLLFIIVFVISACQNSTVPVDIEAEKATLNEMFANYEENFIKLETDSLLALYSEDMLICGSDPNEFWNREVTKKSYDAQRGPDLPEVSFFGDRIIKVAPDGKSAFVIEQMNVAFCPGLPWRQVHYLLKKDGKWLISVSSFGIIPKNEDLPDIFAAIAAKKRTMED
jgi:hypothetical protein